MKQKKNRYENCEYVCVCIQPTTRVVYESVYIINNNLFKRKSQTKWTKCKCNSKKQEHNEWMKKSLIKSCLVSIIFWKKRKLMFFFNEWKRKDFRKSELFIYSELLSLFFWFSMENYINIFPSCWLLHHHPFIFLTFSFMFCCKI